MSDTPIPPPSAPPPMEPAPPTATPRRPGTILGRLSQAVREQNWFAVALEVLIVIVGVVIGFQVTAWGSERAARATEQELLANLQTEFETNRELYDANAARLRRAMDQAQRLLALTGPTPQPHRPAEIDSLLVGLLGFPDFAPETGQVQSLLSTGRIVLIQHDSLRAALAAWPDAFQILEQEEENVREAVIHRFIPYLQSRVPLATMDYRTGLYEGDGPSRFAQEYDALLSDMEFENLVEDRYILSKFQLRSGQRGREMIDDVLRWISDERGP
ncbi:hypothetical protein [Rubrivirga sp. IMCC45206]|uniref:hypothetical protein n=1 Tax=Rubrivirga sp. IMCC45206 TaxID=3391614 RepID=UPI00398FB64C